MEASKYCMKNSDGNIINTHAKIKSIEKEIIKFNKKDYDISAKKVWKDKTYENLEGTETRENTRGFWFFTTAEDTNTFNFKWV